ncbi:hypothetical protein Trydic_g18783 [Trypoxylus dichotomus]
MASLSASRSFQSPIPVPFVVFEASVNQRKMPHLDLHSLAFIGPHRQRCCPFDVVKDAGVASYLSTSYSGGSLKMVSIATVGVDAILFGTPKQVIFWTLPRILTA